MAECTHDRITYKKFDDNGRPRKFMQGHNNYRRN
jgi:hypothetical protein